MSTPGPPPGLPPGPLRGPPAGPTREAWAGTDAHESRGSHAYTHPYSCLCHRGRSGGGRHDGRKTNVRRYPVGITLSVGKAREARGQKRRGGFGDAVHSHSNSEPEHHHNAVCRARSGVCASAQWDAQVLRSVEGFLGVGGVALAQQEARWPAHWRRASAWRRVHRRVGRPLPEADLGPQKNGLIGLRCGWRNSRRGLYQRACT